jgi:hypothetical protein
MGLLVSSMGPRLLGPFARLMRSAGLVCRRFASDSLTICREGANLSEGGVNGFQNRCGRVGLADESEDADFLGKRNQFRRLVDGEKENGCVGAEFTYLLCGFEAGAARHAEVENHQVGVYFPHHGDGLFAIAGFGKGLQISAQLEDFTQAFAHGFVIVCDQDSHVAILSPEFGKWLSGELGSLSKIYRRTKSEYARILCLWTKGGSELSESWRR